MSTKSATSALSRAFPAYLCVLKRGESEERRGDAEAERKRERERECVCVCMTERNIFLIYFSLSPGEGRRRRKRIYFKRLSIGGCYETRIKRR
jgi:hypothetical protein